MTKTQFIQWLQAEQLTIEQIILEAATQFVKDHQRNPNFGYDLQCAQQEAYNLGDGKDLCYDRYTTPLAYSLWYQARRINVFLSHFLDKVVEACQAGRPIEVFDLGAGTGCVQFCFGLAAVASQRLTQSSSLVRIINVDSSPFMLNYLRSYLWPAALKRYQELKAMPVVYNVYSWNNRADFSVTNPWICASYLFDSSENEDYLVSNFNELVKAFEPQKILLLTSNQPKKKVLMNDLSAALRKKEYQLTTFHSSNDVLAGTLTTVTDFRQKLVHVYCLKASSYPVIWSDKSFTALGLEKHQTGFAYDLNNRPDGLDIFNPPLRIRRQVELNDEQRKAAAYDERPSIITGPAGCGKSIVVTAKIINVLQLHNWLGPLRILVTTFNISLLKQLRQWTTELLELKAQPVRQHHYKTVNNQNDGTGKIVTGVELGVEIEFIHFEMLAKYVGRIRYRPFDERVHISKLQIIIGEVRQLLGIPDGNMKNILTPQFILEEYHRITYGMQCMIRDGEQAYLEVRRDGRGKGLDRIKHRPAVWQVLQRYAIWMAKDPDAGQSFMARRQLLYNELTSGRLSPQYDYLFVDEFQDCTRTDFEIMNRLLKNTNRLVLAGDMAQAVHIGKSGFIPKDEDSNNRKRYQLKGSYRLPFRICEAIHPLSKQINKVSLEKDATAEISPYKGAPPGARPIVVFGETTELLAQKLVAIKNAYAVFAPTCITIMEKDEALCRAVRALGAQSETTTILRLKGLEKDFVVWSLQATIEYEDEVLEFAYTIMTRTNCLLVIALTPINQQVYLPALKFLSHDRLIFWDETSQVAFGHSVMSIKEPAVSFEE